MAEYYLPKSDDYILQHKIIPILTFFIDWF